MSTGAAALRVLLVRHEQATPGGWLTTWLAEKRADVTELRIDIDDRRVDPARYQLVVSLGAEFAAYDELAHVSREMRLLREALDASIPVLGICFGGQLLSRVLGGQVARAPHAEIGWRHVQTSDPALVPGGPWLQWHHDAFTVPPGATLIAENDAGPQAYVFERSLGLQFHPEATPEMVTGWARSARQELDDAGVDAGALLRETAERAADARAMAGRLFQRYLERVARVTAAAA